MVKNRQKFSNIDKNGQKLSKVIKNWQKKVFDYIIFGYAIFYA